MARLVKHFEMKAVKRATNEVPPILCAFFTDPCAAPNALPTHGLLLFAALEGSWHVKVIDRHA